MKAVMQYVKKASHGNKTELYSVTCLHTMLEICAHSGGLPIRYKVNYLIIRICVDNTIPHIGICYVAVSYAACGNKLRSKPFRLCTYYT